MGRHGAELHPLPAGTGFQAFLIIVCVAIYAVLVQNIALVDDIIYAIWTCMATRCCCASACSKRAALPSPCSMRINGGDTMLTLTPVTLATANAFVNAHHRHHKATAGISFHRLCKDGELVGVAIVGRPVSRYLDDGWTLEVNRLCTTGEKNACSILYAASARAAKAMGYRKIITYTLDSESGSSLRAVGWSCAGLAGGKCWTGSRKPASALYPAQMKLRYEKLL